MAEFPTVSRGELESLAATMALRDTAVARYGADPKVSLTAVRKLEAMTGVRRKELEAQKAAAAARRPATFAELVAASSRDAAMWPQSTQDAISPVGAR